MGPALTLLLRSDAPLPVVLCHVAAARPAQAGGMQLLDGLQDVGTESAQILTCLRGHGHHIDLYRSVLDHDDEVAVAAKLGDRLDGLYAQVSGDIYKGTGCRDAIHADSAVTINTFDHLGMEREFIFLPLLAHLKRLAGDNIAFRTAQSDNQLSLALCIDGAYEVLAVHVQRTLENAGFSLSCRDLLRIAHVDGIVLNQTVLATLAEGRPLLGNGRNTNVARSTFEEHLAVGSRQTDIAIGGLSIVHPKGDEVAVGTLQSVTRQHLFAIPEHRHFAPTALYAEFVPLLFLVHLFFRSWGRYHWRQHVHAASQTSTEAWRLTHFHRTDGEIGCSALLLKRCPCSSLVGSVNLRLRLSRCKRATLIIWVVYADVIGCAIRLVTESKTDVHQSPTPSASC